MPALSHVVPGSPDSLRYPVGPAELGEAVGEIDPAVHFADRYATSSNLIMQP